MNRKLAKKFLKLTKISSFLDLTKKNHHQLLRLERDEKWSKYSEKSYQHLKCATSKKVFVLKITLGKIYLDRDQKIRIKNRRETHSMYSTSPPYELGVWRGWWAVGSKVKVGGRMHKSSEWPGEYRCIVDFIHIYIRNREWVVGWKSRRGREEKFATLRWAKGDG